MTSRSCAEILNSARTALSTAELGYEDLIGDDVRRRMAGLQNLVVFGRAVTNILQNLRGPLGAERFDIWYLPKQAEMSKDPLMRYFYKMRSEILKQGHVTTSVTTKVRSLGPIDFAELTANPPPGAESFFMGDRMGGNGWKVRLPSGEIEMYYVTLPTRLQDEVSSTTFFQEAPVLHMGREIDGESISQMSRRYLDYLQELLAEANTEFRAGP